MSYLSLAIHRPHVRSILPQLGRPVARASMRRNLALTALLALPQPSCVTTDREVATRGGFPHTGDLKAVAYEALPESKITRYSWADLAAHIDAGSIPFNTIDCGIPVRYYLVGNPQARRTYHFCPGTPDIIASLLFPALELGRLDPWNTQVVVTVPPGRPGSAIESSHYAFDFRLASYAEIRRMMIHALGLRNVIYVPYSDALNEDLFALMEYGRGENGMRAVGLINLAGVGGPFFTQLREYPFMARLMADSTFGYVLPKYFANIIGAVGSGVDDLMLPENRQGPVYEAYHKILSDEWNRGGFLWFLPGDTVSGASQTIRKSLSLTDPEVTAAFHRERAFDLRAMAGMGLKLASIQMANDGLVRREGDTELRWATPHFPKLQLVDANGQVVNAGKIETGADGQNYGTLLHEYLCRLLGQSNAPNYAILNAAHLCGVVIRGRALAVTLHNQGKAWLP